MIMCNLATCLPLLPLHPFTHLLCTHSLTLAPCETIVSVPRVCYCQAVIYCVLCCFFLLFAGFWILPCLLCSVCTSLEFHLFLTLALSVNFGTLSFKLKTWSAVVFCLSISLHDRLLHYRAWMQWKARFQPKAATSDISISTYGKWSPRVSIFQLASPR